MDTRKFGENSWYNRPELSDFFVGTENGFEGKGVEKIPYGENTSYVSPYNQIYHKKKEVSEAGSIYLDKLYENAILGHGVEIAFSPSFTKRNVAKLVSDIVENGSGWIKSFKSPDELLYIRTINKTVEEKSKYFDFDPGTRIFLGNIQNFLIYWKDLEVKHIKQFLILLDKFKSGDISEESLDNFSREIFLIQSRIKNAKNSKNK